MNKKLVLAVGCLLIVLMVSAMTLLAHDDDLPSEPDNAVAAVTLDYTPTYYQQVQPIMQTNCVSCHLEGEIGYEVFSMASPEEIMAAARDIQLVINTGYMPPWPPSEVSPHFLYERTLTDEEKAIISAWVSAGAPMGDADTAVHAEPAQTVPPVVPDLTLQMPAPYTPNPENSDDYRCFMLDPGFTEDTYITGYDIIPDNTASVHHTILFLATEEQRAEAEAKNGADGQPGWTCYGATGLTTGGGNAINPEMIDRILPIITEFGGLSGLQQLFTDDDAAAQIEAAVAENPDSELAAVVEQFGGANALVFLINRTLGRDSAGRVTGIGTIGSWVPGNQPTHFPEGSGILIPEGDFIVMQMHYYTAGSTEPDQSSVVLETATGNDMIALARMGAAAPVEIPCPADVEGDGCDRIVPEIETSLNSDMLLAICGQTADQYINQDGTNATTSCDYPAITTGWAISINNHMHQLGTVTRTTLNPDTPDEQILIDIQDWDFDWQGDYWFAEPIWIEQGDIIRLTCSWDNSVSRDNPEPRYVVWGEGTSDEMCLSGIAVLPAEAGTPPPTQYGMHKDHASMAMTDTHDDMATGHNHDMPMDLSDNDRTPEVFLSVTPDPLGGYNVRVQTFNFTFAPQNTGLAHRDGEGHAHLYVNGEKVTRIYGEWFYLDELPLGENTLTVSLNSNTHAPLYANGSPISATVTLAIIE